MADYEEDYNAGGDEEAGSGGGINRNGRTLLYMLVAPAITRWILSQQKVRGHSASRLRTRSGGSPLT